MTADDASTFFRGLEETRDWLNVDLIAYVCERRVETQRYAVYGLLGELQKRMGDDAQGLALLTNLRHAVDELYSETLYAASRSGLALGRQETRSPRETADWLMSRLGD